MGKIKGLSFSDMLDQFYGSSAGSSNPQLGQGQGSTLGGAGSAGATSDPYAGMFGNLDPAILKQLIGGITIGLTAEEKEEFDRLTVEHKHEIRKHKMEAFKKIAPEMRQFVINALTWNDELGNINNTPVDKSQRLTELEVKSRGGFNSHSHTYNPANAWYPGTRSEASISLSSFVGIPEGLTVEDLKQAHIEATLEEEMLNGEEEKS